LRYLDDPTLGTLTSMIYFNNVVIISRLSDNGPFMKELFGRLQHYAALANLSAPHHAFGNNASRSSSSTAISAIATPNASGMNGGNHNGNHYTLIITLVQQAILMI
jgi:hypothetical protein